MTKAFSVTPLVLAPLLVFVAGCASGPPHDQVRVLEDADYPGVLRVPSSFGTDVQWRQVVTAGWGEKTQSFDAAVLAQGETLRVVGMSPVGVGFVLELRKSEPDGTQITFENRSGEPMPFPPRFVLLDVQRVFYPWLPQPPIAGGERSGTVDGERIVEVFRDGRLVERRFERLEGEPTGVIRVEYEWGRPDWLAPTRARLHNGWFGYSLTVRTSEEHQLADR